MNTNPIQNSYSLDRAIATYTSMNKDLSQVGFDEMLSFSEMLPYIVEALPDSMKSEAKTYLSNIDRALYRETSL